MLELFKGLLVERNSNNYILGCCPLLGYSIFAAADIVGKIHDLQNLVEMRCNFDAVDLMILMGLLKVTAGYVAQLFRERGCQKGIMY
jgi:hypothetical protein